MTEYIRPFDYNHFIYIGIFTVFTFLLFTKKEFVRESRDKISFAILVVSIMQQILLYYSYYVLYDFDLAVSLPLHISRINSILGIIFLITKNKTIFKILSYTGFFALLSFLYPSQVHKITSPIGVSFLVNHIITLLLPSYIIIAYDYKLGKKDKNMIFIMFLVYLIVVYFINLKLDGNYFYLESRPLEFLNNIPDIIYLIICSIVSYLVFTVAEIFYKFLYKKV